MSQKNSLIIPPVAERDSDSFEILRVWVADKGQHISLNVGVWDDPAFWGIMLADLAGHIANAYHENLGLDRENTLKRIKAGLLAELSSPTD